MDNPTQDLIALKQVCKEIQREIAFRVPDAEVVARLADEARYLADSIGTWARKQ